MATEGSGIFVQKLNHAKGRIEWKMMPENYDYNQELARAAFADMLHDDERNKLYRVGLQAAIKEVRARGQKVRVLDIGTGTGLLSMMAAAEGVDSIVACEEFRPMAECASRIIEENGFQDRIKLVRKRSTELTVGPGCDMEERANILVTEVFDTELIGEGAIGTYNHASRELLTEDRLVVPGVARIFAQAVSCKKASDWSRLHPIHLQTGKKLETGDHLTINKLVLHDVQLSQLDETLFTPLSPPVQVFSFDLACRDGPMPHTQTDVQKFTALNSGTCTAVFMWWDCWTDPANSVLLSCAPKWIHHDPKRMPWRDHWMQAIYYPQQDVEVVKGDELVLQSDHDEYSLWFDVRKEEKQDLNETYLPISRTRLGEMNNSSKNRQYESALTGMLYFNPGASVLALSEPSLLGLMAAMQNTTSKVTILQENNQMTGVLQDLAIKNGVTNKVKFVPDLDEVKETFDVVIGDPFFSFSLLPWHNLLFWNHLTALRQRGSINATTSIMPGNFSLWVVPVHYEHLWKIRAPLHHIEGFNMRHFDKIIDEASVTADDNIEPHPLWEYPCTALGAAHQAVAFDLTNDLPEETQAFTGSIAVDSSRQDLNGMAVWCDWELVPGSTVSTGPCREITVGEPISWNMDAKQGVHFFRTPSRASSVVYNIKYDPTEGDFTFEFNLD